MSHTSSRFTLALLTLSFVIVTFLLAAVWQVASAVKAAAPAPQVMQQPSGCDKIVFGSGGEIIVMNSNGSGRMRLDVGSLTVTRSVISPNGRLVAFVGSSAGQEDLHIVSTDGTGQQQLTNDLDTFNYEVGALAFSSDSSRITFMAERDQNGRDEVHIVNADGTGLARLTFADTIDATNPSFNPDGTRIVFEAGNGVNGRDIFLINPDGTGLTNLTFTLDGVNFGEPYFKPDGARIVFSGNLDGEDDSDIFAINPDGSARTRLTDTDTDEYSPEYSPDGSRIFFSSNRSDGATFQVHVMNLDGANQVRLTNEEDSVFTSSIAFLDRDNDGIGDPCDNCAAVSNSDQLNADGDLQGDACDEDDDNDDVPDSTDNCPLNKNANQLNTDGDLQGNVCDADDDNDRTPDESDNCPLNANGNPIAFASRRAGNIEIYKMNLDGTGVIRLTNHTSVDEDPSFNSAGSRILFTSNRFNNRYEVFLMNANGTAVTRLTNIAGSNRTASFNPAGTKITFISTRDGNRSVYIMDANGANQTRLTFTQGFSGVADNPTFNHDGTRIAFDSDRGSVGQANHDIFTINPNGTSELRLTTATGRDSDPAYSRDGSKVVFVSERNGNREIYIMNSDGTNQTRLTDNPALERHPTFTPDGKSIAFTSTRNGDEELYLMNVDGTGVTQLTNATNESYFASLAPQLDTDADGIGDACDPSITTTINPTADTWVQGADATRDTNYGADTALQIKRTLNPGAGRGRRGFLKFDFSQVTSTISSVRLRVFGNLTDASLPPTAMIVQKVTDTTWDELAMPWNNQPPTASPNALAQITVLDATPQWYEFDLTAFILAERAEGRNVVSLRLINQSPTGNSGAFYTIVNSREATSEQPRLVIEQ